MNPLFCLFLLFSPFVCSEVTDVFFPKEGERIKLTCSECQQQTGGELYLFHRFLDDRYHDENEVLYFGSKHSQASVRGKYKDNVSWDGSFSNLSITIRNVSANSEGVYNCRYSGTRTCTSQIYILHVKGSKKTPKPENCPDSDCPDSQILMTVIILVCLFFMVVIAFILLFPRVKQRVKKESDTEHNGPINHLSSTEYVYEDMRKNPVYSRVGQVQCPRA